MESIDLNYLIKKEALLILLKKNELHLNKNLGQNFLVDGKIREKLTSFIPSDIDFIIEIGPGIGHFTSFLLKKTPRLLAIEIDKGFFNILSHIFKTSTKVKVLHEDILKISSELLKENIVGSKNPIIVGNLPYNLSTDILIKILKWDLDVSQLFLLFQKEFVMEKLLFKKDSTHLSHLYCQLYPYYRVKLLSLVPKQSFFPAPHVDSAFVELNSKNHSYTTSFKKNYTHFLNSMFANPGRLLQNKLSTLYQMSNLKDAFNQEKILENSRIEHLNINQIMNLFDYLNDQE